jgi:hypothetical protein
MATATKTKKVTNKPAAKPKARQRRQADPVRVRSMKPTDEEVRSEFVRWYVVAKSVVDGLYHGACEMSFQIKQGDCPLAKCVSLEEMQRLVRGLEEATCGLADIVPNVGIELPDPMSVIRGN